MYILMSISEAKRNMKNRQDIITYSPPKLTY